MHEVFTGPTESLVDPRLLSMEPVPPTEIPVAGLPLGDEVLQSALPEHPEKVGVLAHAQSLAYDALSVASKVMATKWGVGAVAAAAAFKFMGPAADHLMNTIDSAVDSVNNALDPSPPGASADVPSAQPVADNLVSPDAQEMFNSNPQEYDNGSLTDLSIMLHKDGLHNSITEQVAYGLGYDAQNLTDEQNDRVKAYTQHILDANGIDVSKGEDRRLAEGATFTISADERANIEAQLAGNAPQTPSPPVEDTTRVEFNTGDLEFTLSDAEHPDGTRPDDTIWEGTAQGLGLDPDNLSDRETVLVDALKDKVLDKYDLTESEARTLAVGSHYELTVREQNEVLNRYNAFVEGQEVASTPNLSDGNAPGSPLVSGRPDTDNWMMDTAHFIKGWGGRSITRIVGGAVILGWLAGKFGRRIISRFRHP